MDLMSDDVLNEKNQQIYIELQHLKGEENSKCILIEAGLGLGKTMLSVKIFKDWAGGLNFTRARRNNQSSLIL